MLVDDTVYLAFCLYWTSPLIANDLNIKRYDPADSYHPQDTVCYVSYRNPQPSWIQPLVDQGFKVIVDHLWDGDVDTVSRADHNQLILRNANWLWYHSCVEWSHSGYDKYQPTPYRSKIFFMPMNRQEWHRDLIVDSLRDVLDHALWSYIAQNKTLPNDVSTTGQVSWRSYFDPDWYDSTGFSVVAESYMRTDSWLSNPRDSHENYKTEVSEKIFKPMMGYHPFMVFGSAHTLKYLHREGFETFENLFDETYDDVLADLPRHQAVSQSVLQSVDDWNQGRIGIDTISQKKLQHNHARLFDKALVKRRVKDEIVADIMEFVEQ